MSEYYPGLKHLTMQTHQSYGGIIFMIGGIEDSTCQSNPVSKPSADEKSRSYIITTQYHTPYQPILSHLHGGLGIKRS